MPVVAKAKILGIWLSTDASEEECFHNNYKTILDKIKNVCDAWSMRGLSIKGKITVVNSLLVSLLQYPCSIIQTPERVFREYKQTISAFLWNDRRPKISHESIIQPVDQGGLKHMDLRVRVQVSLLQWVRRLLKTAQMNVGFTLCHILKIDNLANFLSFRKPPLPPDIGKHKFYKNMLSTYAKFHNFEPVSEDTIRDEFLWHNPQVGGKSAPIFWPHWAKAGISRVGHICHATEDRLPSHSEISDKYSSKVLIS